MVTIKEIAEKAGVSTATVSRALNGKPDIALETKKKILAIVKELNYTPNNIARAFVTKKTKCIGVVVADNANPFYAEIIRGIEETTMRKGYSIILCNTSEDIKREIKAIQVLKEKRVDGMIINPTQKKIEHLRALKEEGIPFVLLNRNIEELEVDCVKNDNIYGAYQATEHLIRLGHKRIGHITGPLYTSSVRERIIGYKKALATYGIPIDESLIANVSLTFQGGYEGALKLLKSSDPPTAIFAYSDIMAIGVIKACKELKIKIPENLSLVGYDDIEISSFIEVPLTTVRQARYTIGTIITDLLIKRIRRPKSKKPPQCIVLKPELVIRNSTMPIESTKLDVSGFTGGLSRYLCKPPRCHFIGTLLACPQTVLIVLPGSNASLLSYLSTYSLLILPLNTES